MTDGAVNQFINKMMQDGFLPGYGEVAEARAELDNKVEGIPSISQIRVSKLDPKLSSEFPYFIMDYLTVEVLRKSAPGVYMKEKLTLNDVDWDEDQLRRDGQILILILILAYATSSIGVAVAVYTALKKRVGKVVFDVVCNAI
ncbi:hypothetical protein [Salimicrobium jeotgali]|uniref:hypothetical protein n=1 Tax=Salimicrobium jeotgali TaxID=1230341 RepID=UPI000C8229E1|nr:hypothetical protein [Salimicrobium jeotgali]